MYIQREQLYFSLLYSNAIYKEGKRQEVDAFRHERSLIFENMLYGGEYQSRGIYSKLAKEEREAFADMILFPPKMKNIFWPSDMVAIQRETQNPNPILKLERKYWGSPEKGSPHMEVQPYYAILFPRLTHKKRRTLAQQLKTLEQKHKGYHVAVSQWRNYNLEEIRHIAIELVKSIYTLNQNRYLYFDFNLNSIWWQNNTVYLDFSNLIYRDPVYQKQQVRMPMSGEFPLEHILPEVFDKKMKITNYAMNEELQNYGLASMLFFLLFGQHPYDGRLCTGSMEDSAFGYEVKYKKLCSLPIFIFDSNYFWGESDNRPGEEGHYKKLKENWEKCPKILQEGFLQALCMKFESGEYWKRSYDIAPKTPKEWLDSFRESRWMK